jgi:hypothetical protein
MPKCLFTGKVTLPVFDTHELAWAAGFFDGEGNCCFNLNKSNPRGSKEYIQPRLRITVAQKSKPMLIRFKKFVLNLGQINGPYKNRIHNEIYNYYVSDFEISQAVMAMLWKYLGDVKKKQFKEALQSYLDYEKV